MPRVTVVIPAYNRAKFLGAAASSVLDQTFTDLELVIVDDGSQDETREVCARLSEHDSRVQYVFQENKGPNAARNAGIRAARGQYIAFLDTDDVWLPAKLEKQLALLKRNPNVDIVYCDWASIDGAGQIGAGLYPPSLGQTLYESLLYHCVIHGSASAVLIRAECFDRVGLFDESFRRLEDWEMWLRLARYYQFVKVPEVLAYLLMDDEYTERNSANIEGMADGRVALAEKMEVLIKPEYKHLLPKAKWHNQLWAAEEYCITMTSKRWHALALALWSWPLGLLSPRTWFVVALCTSGPFYIQTKTAGAILGKWCSHALKWDSITGWGMRRRGISR